MEYGKGEGRAEIRLFSDYWNRKIAAELNDSYIKLAKLKGELVWHYHEKEDELFFMMKGRLAIKLREGEVRIGLENSWSSRAVSMTCRWRKDEVHAILIEPKTTLNTGNVVGHKTVTESRANMRRTESVTVPACRLAGLAQLFLNNDKEAAVLWTRRGHETKVGARPKS